MTDNDDEQKVRCPIEGCDREVSARGLYLHVRQTDGDGHGPTGEVPDGVDLDTAVTVGQQEGKDAPDGLDDEVYARLCPHCTQICGDLEELRRHLDQNAGWKNHPENANVQYAPEDFPRVVLDSAGDLERVVATTPPDPADILGKGAVPLARVFELIADLTTDGEKRTAHRVRRALLGTDDAVAPSRDDPPYPDLFEALVFFGRTDGTTHRLTTALEVEGLWVAFHGEGEVLTAEEAREIADRLEQVAAVEGWQEGDAADFIAFLRAAADVYDGEKTEQDLHEEFDIWG